MTAEALSATPSVAPEIKKPIHTILLDTSPILLNTPSISTLLANSDELVTTPAVLAEIRGEEARSRLETLYKPFLQIRTPKPESVKFVREFARKTGDGGVLSTTDCEILALAYDLECERNGGDWRLRNAPGQKRLNGSPPSKDNAVAEMVAAPAEDIADLQNVEESSDTKIVQQMADASLDETRNLNNPDTRNHNSEGVAPTDSDGQRLQATGDAPIGDPPDNENQNAVPTLVSDEQASSDSDDGWITPSNIKRHQAKDDNASNVTQTETRVLQVATMTGDFAMQNVLLQMNLNLLSTKTCKRVAHIKQMILRCHGCFNTTRDLSKQFCPRCGKPTLTRVTCTTNDKGEVKLHLKANHQWNNRGNVFSIPKPVSGSANQKWKGPRQGGGQGGWGSELILAEDQKEYVRSMSSAKRTKKKDLMDEDTLPSIISGERERAGGRMRIGAGRNVNSRKR